MRAHTSGMRKTSRIATYHWRVFFIWVSSVGTVVAVSRQVGPVRIGFLEAWMRFGRFIDLYQQPSTERNKVPLWAPGLRFTHFVKIQIFDWKSCKHTKEKFIKFYQTHGLQAKRKRFLSLHILPFALHFYTRQQFNCLEAWRTHWNLVGGTRLLGIPDTEKTFCACCPN